MSKEALKLALEALEVCEQHGYIPVRLTTDAITAIKEALAQPEQKYRRGNRLICLETEEYCVIHISGTDRQWVKFPTSYIGVYTNEQVAELFELLPKEPEFIKHEVKNADDWSEWVCPDPKNYLMKCCDCGLVHEAEFGVVRYKSETERDDCDMVNDPNLQAVFRMRRSEEWMPEDTAQRVGGLPMSQPPQRKPLTDEQIKDVATSCMWWVREQDILDDAIELARAIEAAHGIKE